MEEIIAIIVQTRSSFRNIAYVQEGRKEGRRGGEQRLGEERKGQKRETERWQKVIHVLSQIFLRDRLSNLPTRCAVEFRQHVD